MLISRLNPLFVQSKEPYSWCKAWLEGSTLLKSLWFSFQFLLPAYHTQLWTPHFQVLSPTLTVHRSTNKQNKWRKLLSGMSAFWTEFHRKQYWSLHFSLAVSIITVWKSLTLSLYLIAIISPLVKQANDLSAFSRLYTNMLRKTLHISLTLKHRRCS